MKNRIYMLRIANNMTMEQLGKLVGVQKSAVNKWEKGYVTNIKSKCLMKMAEIFDVSPAYILGIDELSNSNETYYNIAIKLAELELTDDELDHLYEYAKFMKRK